MKGHNSGTTILKRYIEKVWGKGMALPYYLWVHCSFKISRCSPVWKLSEPPSFGFLWQLLYIDMLDYIIGHWQSVQLPDLPSSPEVEDWNLKFQTSTALMRCFPKVTTSIWQKTALLLLSLRKFYRIYLFLTAWHSMWDLSSLTRDWTCILCIGGVASQPLDSQGKPKKFCKF